MARARQASEDRLAGKAAGILVSCLQEDGEEIHDLDIGFQQFQEDPPQVRRDNPVARVIVREVLGVDLGHFGDGYKNDVDALALEPASRGHHGTSLAESVQRFGIVQVSKIVLRC